MDTQTKEAQNMDSSDVEYYDNQQLVYSSNPCKKFDDSKTATTEKNTCYRDIHIITLPEMYLVAAEAYLKAGDNPKALARLNEVHQRWLVLHLQELSLSMTSLMRMHARTSVMRHAGWIFAEHRPW